MKGWWNGYFGLGGAQQTAPPGIVTDSLEQQYKRNKLVEEQMKDVPSLWASIEHAYLVPSYTIHMDTAFSQKERLMDSGETAYNTFYNARSWLPAWHAVTNEKREAWAAVERQLRYKFEQEKNHELQDSSMFNAVFDEYNRGGPAGVVRFIREKLLVPYTAT